MSPQTFSQSGPEVPCGNCEQLTSLTHNVIPSTGFWYNPEQSGSGFSIEVKKRTVFAAYYGYDDGGKPIWFTFVGQLTPSEKTGVMWEVDSNLSEFNGGNSLNNEYKPPTLANSSHIIHIEFNNMNHARFTVDGGSIQNIVPVAYGVEHVTYFPEKTSLKIPDLMGYWVFSLRVNTEIHPTNQYFISGFHPPFMVHLPKGDFKQYDDGTSLISFTLNQLQQVPELGLLNGGVGCFTFLDDNNNIQGPLCYLFIFVDEIREYNMPIGGIGINKLFGETEDGYTFKAFRYDYCDFNERDITYVCEYDYSNNKQLALDSKVSIHKTIPKTTNIAENSTTHISTKGQAFEAYKALKLKLLQQQK